MINNEKGFALPLMIAITFVAASLLLMLATGLEVKVASYERSRTYMVMSLLEREGLEMLEYLLSTADMISDLSSTWKLRDNAMMTVNVTEKEDVFTFHYQIVYNGYMRSQKLLFCPEKGLALPK